MKVRILNHFDYNSQLPAGYLLTKSLREKVRHFSKERRFILFILRLHLWLPLRC